MPTTIFFTVGDARYFPGVVGLVNSLRIVGHSEEIVVLDAGFTPVQRQALAATCTIAEFSNEARDAANPTYYKLVAPRMREFARGDVFVVIDSDVVVTAPLDDLINRAVAGQLAAFPDPESDRWFADWQGIFGLTSPPRSETYICAGVVVFSPAQLPDLIAKWWARCQLIADQPTVAEGAEGPTSQADQDALNAILMSEYPAGTVYCEDIDRFPAAAELAKFARHRDACRPVQADVYVSREVVYRSAFGRSAEAMAHAPRNTQKRVRRAPFGHAHSPRTGRHGPTGRGAILARQRADGSSRALCIRAAHGGRASPDSGHQQAARIGDHSKPHLACRPSGRRDFPFRGGGEGAPPQRTGRTLRGAARARRHGPPEDGAHGKAGRGRACWDCPLPAGERGHSTTAGLQMPMATLRRGT